MATKDNIPSPPKALQRGLGLLNPPQVRVGLDAISPPPNPAALTMPEGDDDSEELATQRLHVGLLQRNPTDDASFSEPLILRNVRLQSAAGDDRNEEIKTQVKARQAIQAGQRAISDTAGEALERRKALQASRRFYDFDEDAITKKILVNRIVTVSPKKGAGDPQAARANIRVETVRQDEMAGAGYRNPMASERPTDLSALGRATQAAARRSSIIPTLRDGLRRMFSMFTRVNGQHGEQLIEPTDTPYQLGANSYSTELYREMRQAIQTGQAAQSSHLPVPRYTYLVSRPPRIVLKGFLLRRESKTSLMLRGRAIHPLSVRDVMIFADKKKILYLSSAARSDAGCIEFSADIPLLTETSHILVVARHNDEVMGSQSLFVKRDG